MYLETFSDQRLSTVKRLVVEALGTGVQQSDISGSTNLYDLGLDSFNVINLLVGIEGAFNVTISPEELTEEVFTRFDNLVSLIEKQLQ